MEKRIPGGRRDGLMATSKMFEGYISKWTKSHKVLFERLQSKEFNEKRPDPVDLLIAKKISFLTHYEADTLQSFFLESKDRKQTLTAITAL